MTTQLPLDDRATCAELFDFACALADALQLIADGNEPEADSLNSLITQFACLRADINEGENL